MVIMVVSVCWVTVSRQRVSMARQCPPPFMSCGPGADHSESASVPSVVRGRWPPVRLGSRRSSSRCR
jgi:hypothetical protein